MSFCWGGLNLFPILLEYRINFSPHVEKNRGVAYNFEGTYRLQIRQEG
jgi:hypothetical protein